MSRFEDYLDERDEQRAADAERRHRDPAWTPPARATAAPEAMVSALLAELNRTFYAAADARAWLRDERDLKLALTWPATWLTKRGIGLPLDRYEALLRDIIAGIREHGDLKAIRHFPTYFAHVVRQWFAHNGETLYEERKRLRNLIDARLLTRTTPGAPAAPDPTAVLAAANRVLASKRHAAKTPRNDEPELPLFGR